jgi:hypothetical protein
MQTGMSANTETDKNVRPTKSVANVAVQSPLPDDGRPMRAALFVVLFVLGSALPVGAEVTVSLLTFGPGAMAFEKFGHTALRIRDAARGLDYAYNWGVFDYEQPNLIGKFVLGRLEYWMEPWNTHLMLDGYRADGRTVWEQELNLTPQQTIDLLWFLEWNERDENKRYKYDYYRDNCTTRVRDALDKAAGGAIARTLQGMPVTKTYRDHTRALTAGDVPLYTGLQIVLAAWVDQPIDAWEEAFLPFELQRHIRAVTTTDDAGHIVPLVRSETTLFTGTYPTQSGRVPTYWPWYLLGSALVGGAMALLAGPARTRAWAAGALFLPVLLWSLLGGIGGAIMWFGWLFTDHVVAYRNENLLQTNVILVAMIPLALVALVFRCGQRWALRTAVVVAVLSIVGLAMKMLPFFRQNNADILAMAIPLNVGLALAMWRLQPASNSRLAVAPQANEPSTSRA